MPHTAIDPHTLPDMNLSNYTHGMVTTGVSKWLNISGQVGLRPDGSLADGALAQCRQAFTNVGKLLEEAGMGPADVCHLRIYLIDRDDLAALRQSRTEFFGPAAKVASTLVLVNGLVDPAWKVELEIVAAK